MGFVNNYGLGAPRAEQYGRYGFFFGFVRSLTIRLGWFGIAGTAVGVLCGYVALYIPFVALFLVPAMIAKAKMITEAKNKTGS